MKRLALAFALALAAASPAAAVTYDFNAYNPFLEQWVGGFTLTTNGFVTQDLTVPASAYTCTSTIGACGNVNFYFDPGNGSPRDVLIPEVGPTGTFYNFAAGTFSTPGEYDVGNSHFALLGHLSITDGVAPVPEPGEWAMLAAGLGVAGFAARRRRSA